MSRPTNPPKPDYRDPLINDLKQLFHTGKTTIAKIGEVAGNRESSAWCWIHDWSKPAGQEKLAKLQEFVDSFKPKAEPKPAAKPKRAKATGTKVVELKPKRVAKPKAEAERKTANGGK